MANSKFEIGDKVKFLNDIGGGVVTKISNGMVYVQDDSGFDIPMAPNSLIRMADQEGVAKVFNIKDEDMHPASSSVTNKSTSTAVYKEPTIEELEDEIKRLKSQNANLQHQVKQLKTQVLSLQRTLARYS